MSTIRKEYSDKERQITMKETTVYFLYTIIRGASGGSFAQKDEHCFKKLHLAERDTYKVSYRDPKEE